MGRPLRIEYPGAFYHITSRGNERKPIFKVRRDYERFLGYLESATERYGARIHCFCLMSNHYHLLLETPRGNCQAILHHINTSYTNYFNARTGRVGHLFQGRYRAVLVEKDSYALELSRYIHLNPFRAQRVDDPSHYRWSSYLAYIGKERKWAWLQKDFVWGQISSDKQKAPVKYWNYIKGAMGEGLKDPLQSAVASTVLGSERFVDWVRERWIETGAFHREVPALRELASRPDLSSILEQVERVFGKDASITRRSALYLSHKVSGLTLVEIGRFFGKISPSAVTQNTRRFEAMLTRDRRLRDQIEGVRRALSE